MSDVSTSRASGAWASGAVAREESLRSRSAMESVRPSAARREALTSSEAVTKYLNGVSGNTTVPMSLPSITTGSRRLYSRCRSTSRERTSGMAAMVETWSLTCGRVSSSPSTRSPHRTTERLPSFPKERGTEDSASSTAAVSAGSMPCSSIYQVTARYMAPVLMNV